MKRPHATVGFLVTLLTLTSLASAQTKRAEPVSKDTAKTAQKQFNSDYRSKDEKIRLAALDRVTPYQHPIIVKCLDRAIKDRSPLVRAAAASGLGLQEKAAALKSLNSAFKNKANHKKNDVMIAIMEAFRRHKSAPRLSDMKKLFEKGSKEVQREIVHTMRYERSLATVAFLGRHVDLPQPVNVDSPTNPPGSYWKAKQERWNYWITQVMESLVHLTGQEFDENKAVMKWRKKGGKLITLEEGEKALKDL